MHNHEQTPSFGAFTQLALLAWLVMIGFDFFLHAGVLARLYLEPSPFLLPPERAFALIPIGYLSFFLSAILLVWLMARLGIQGCRQGGWFGLQLGALTWGAFGLGLLTISTAPIMLTLGWFVGQTLELGIGGMVVGSGFATRQYRRLLMQVLAFTMGAFVVTIILQSLGLAPAVKIGD